MMFKCHLSTNPLPLNPIEYSPQVCWIGVPNSTSYKCVFLHQGVFSPNHLIFFGRQLDSPENFQIPDEIVTSWKQAVASKSRAAKNAVFQSFLKAGKDWSKLFGYMHV